MIRSRKVTCKTIVVPIGEIVEGGFHIGLNSVIHFQRHNDSKNISIQSVLHTSRKTVSISSTIEGAIA